MSLLYLVGNAARFLARSLTRLYYPVIEVDGREHIPASGGVLFAANHPNSMLDPAVLGIVAQRPIHFFAKATLFDIPVFGPLMQALGMVPAFRGVDDKSQVRRNVETLSLGANYLVKGQAVGIFPEGKSHDLPHVEQVKTGVARIAMQAVQAGGDFKIVPVGLNYEKKSRFGTAVWVCVGEALDAKAWFAAHPGDEHKAMRSLSAELDQRLKRIVVHLNKVEWQPFLENLEASRPPPQQQTHCRTAGLRQRKRIADAMNYFLGIDPARAEKTALAIQEHRERVAAAGLTVQSPVLQYSGWTLWKRMLLDAALFLCGLPFVMAGTLYHLAPFVLTRRPASASGCRGK